MWSIFKAVHFPCGAIDCWYIHMSAHPNICCDNIQWIIWAWANELYTGIFNELIVLGVCKHIGVPVVPGSLNIFGQLIVVDLHTVLTYIHFGSRLMTTLTVEAITSVPLTFGLYLFGSAITSLSGDVMTYENITDLSLQSTAVSLFLLCCYNIVIGRQMETDFCLWHDRLVNQMNRYGPVLAYCSWHSVRVGLEVVLKNNSSGMGCKDTHRDTLFYDIYLKFDSDQVKWNNELGSNVALL